MKKKNNTLLSLVLPAVLCTALWGSAAPCVKKGYELFEIAAGDSFSQLVFAGWRFTLAGVLGLGGLDGFHLHGDGLILLSAVSAGAGALVSRIYTPGRDPMLLTGWQLALGGTFLGLLGRLGGGALGSVTVGGAALLGYMIVLSAAAFTVWTALLGRFPVGRVSLFGFLIPVFGALFSALVLGGEHHDRAQPAVAPARQRRHRAGKFRRGFLEKLTRTRAAPLFLCRFCDFSCHRVQMVLY